MAPETPLGVDEIDLSDQNFWLRGDRDACFATLRRQRPVAWCEEFEGPGYWAITCYADVQHVSRTPDTFISGTGSTSSTPHRSGSSSSAR